MLPSTRLLFGVPLFDPHPSELLRASPVRPELQAELSEQLLDELAAADAKRVSEVQRLLRPGGETKIPGASDASCISGAGFCQCSSMCLGVTFPFFPGILLSRKPPKPLGKWLPLECLGVV